MATAITTMPLLEGTFRTGTNEDWADVMYVTQDSVPFDFTDIEFEMVARQSAENHDAFIPCSTANGFLQHWGAEGYFAFRVPEETMRRVPAAVYVFDIVARADGHQIVFLTGTVDVNLGITREVDVVL